MQSLSKVNSLKEPLLESVVTHEHSRRFLSETFYRRELKKFRSYHPEDWWDTLQVRATKFIVLPWCFLVISTLILTKVTKDYLPSLIPVVSLNPMVHTVLGSALSFVVVFRTNAVCVRHANRHHSSDVFSILTERTRF